MPVRRHEACEPWSLVEPGWETSEREDVAGKSIWRPAWRRAQQTTWGIVSVSLLELSTSVGK